MKIICFGVRNYERKIFEEIQKTYGYKMTLSDLYVDDNSYEIAMGYDAIILRANCILSEKSLSILKNGGLKYLLTRTVGYNHIDLQACKKLGIKVAYAPGYSPDSIAELAFSLAISLLRNIPEAINSSSKGSFLLNDRMFGREIKNCTVGIIGCGRIGKATAKLFKSFGAKVLGFDLYEDEDMDGVISYCSINRLLKESDIISLHMSYDEKVNYHFIGEKEFKKMKNSAIFINTARGELVDIKALIENIKTNHLFGAGLDVLENEKQLFFKEHDVNNLDDVAKEMLSLYPRIIITPHISSSTESAVYDSLKISLNNLLELESEGKCKNSLG